MKNGNGGKKMRKIFKYLGGALMAMLLMTSVAHAAAVTISITGITNHSGSPLPANAFVQVIQSDDAAKGAPGSNGLPAGDTVVATGKINPNGTFSGGASISSSKYIYIRAWESWDGTGNPLAGTYYGDSAAENVGAGFVYTYDPPGFSTNQQMPVQATLSSISPTSRGQGAQSQNLILTGTNFQAGATVQFSGSGIGITSTTVNSSTQITVTVNIDAAAATGARNVTVTNPSASPSNAVTFTVNAGPLAASANPPSGDQGWSGNVTLTGSNFHAGTWGPSNVVFSGSGITVNSVTRNSDTQLTVGISIAAGAAASSRTVTVLNSDDAGTLTSGNIFTVNGPPNPPTITTTSLPNGTVSVAYNQTVSATGGTTPYTWAISAGSLPTGLSINSSTGVISGTPTAAGASNFTIRVTDAAAQQDTQDLSITIGSVPPPDPIISGILPATAEVGQTIVISGSNFGATKETSTITVGGVAANPTAWSASSITVAVPTGVATGSADVVVTVGAKNDSSSITVDGSKIMIDDFEGGSVGVWGATQGLADSGYYAFGTGITPDNNNITANGPKAEAVKEGAKGMKVQYSFTSGWGGGWGATLANQLDLTDAKYVSFYVNWDGSANAIKLSLLDNDGTSYAITITNATLAALSGYAKVTLDKASFSYDLDGSATGSNTTFDWTKVSKYNFVYNTNGTTVNYQYIDSLTASATNEVPPPPPPTGEAPVINSASPSAAAGGSQITVTGLRFGSTQDNSRLDFTNLSTNVTYHANIIRWSDTTIEANVPLAPIGNYTIKVIQIRGGSGPVTALESNPASFMVTFNPTPGIATISPNPFNAGKESVTINVASSVGGATINNIGYYIFDMTAQLVHREVISGTQTTWNGLDQNNAVVGDGAYILRVINEDSKSLIAKGKILVIKR